MPRPLPTPIMHFTHVDHLPLIVRAGLVSDTVAQKVDLLSVEVGNREIKERRRQRQVPVSPGGVVADYAPFYFAPRSPMMYAIEKRNVPTYSDGCDQLVYLVTTVEQIIEMGLAVVFTDRNAVLALANFTSDVDQLDTLVDWLLMEATWWNNTPQEPDRRERRMAECLVYECVPWAAFHQVVVRNEACNDQVYETLATVGVSLPIAVTPGWYF